MPTSRRGFIITTGLSAIGLQLSAFNGLKNLTSFSSQLITDLPRMSPESQGVLSSGIRNFLKATQTSGLEWHSFMLVRHGNVVAEGWWKPFDAANKHTLYSLSKSFTSSAIGFLVSEGKISVDDQVIKFFPEHTPVEVSDNLRALKIKHLLTMNTGHDTDTLPVMFAKENQSWIKTFLNHPVIHQPSTHFLYNTGATYMLGAIVHKISGQILEEYLEPRLFAPLGIKNYDWEKSPQGLNTAGYGLRIKTEDIAKLGQLYLQKGKWQDKQLLPEAWIAEATQKQTASQGGDNDWSQGYGYQFWRCKPGFYRGDGAFGQFCMIMPEQDAVLAMTCESFDLQKTMNVAYETILPALKNVAQTENTVELSALKNEISKLTLPVPKGNQQATLINQMDGNVYAIEKNSYGVNQISFAFFNDGGVVSIYNSAKPSDSSRALSENSSAINNYQLIEFGWEKWKVNKNVFKNPFPVFHRTDVVGRIAATATWMNDNTLQINLKFIEAIHGDKLTIGFNGDKISMTFLNSVSENSKDTPDKREPIMGSKI